MPTVYPDAYHVTQPTSLSNTTETTCYTVPTGKWAYVQQLIACDAHGNERHVTIKYSKSSVDYVLRYQDKVCANHGLELQFEPLYLAEGETIKCTADIGIYALHITINALEVAQPRI